MANDSDCKGAYVGLSLTSLALLISVCLNILLYSLRRKERQDRDVVVPLCQDSFHSDRFEEEERLNQDNPIYGNIFVDRGGPLTTDEYRDYECMANQSARQDEKAEPGDVSYASLDLSVVQKRKKKKKYQHKQSQPHQVQTHTPPVAQPSCMEMGADCDVVLPSRTSSLMVSRGSIYLNSHQVALENEELERERERERDREREWKNNHEQEMIMNLHGNFDHGLGQSEPSHELGS